MAQRTTVILLDDLDSEPAEQSVEFGLDGHHYEIDLTDAHAQTLRDVLAAYIAHARRTGGRPARRATTPARRNGATSPSTADREQNKAIRDWAARHGHPLAPRGRIPAAVSEAFHRGDPAALAGGSAESTGSATVDAATVDAATVDAATVDAGTDAAGTDQGTSAPRLGPDGLSSDERERIRAWALDEGIEVKARGRLTKDLIANYRAVQARR